MNNTKVKLSDFIHTSKYTSLSDLIYNSSYNIDSYDNFNSGNFLYPLVYFKTNNTNRLGYIRKNRKIWGMTKYKYEMYYRRMYSILTENTKRPFKLSRYKPKDEIGICFSSF